MALEGGVGGGGSSMRRILEQKLWEQTEVDFRT